MASFICKACGAKRDFSLHRGFKVADQRCSCGGSFGREDRDTGKVLVLGPSANSGKKAKTCALCGRKVFKYFRTLSQDGEIEVWHDEQGKFRHYGLPGYNRVKVQFKKGDHCCTTHYGRLPIAVDPR